MVFSTSDLTIENDGIYLKTDFYPAHLIAGASYTRDGVKFKSLFGAALMAVLAFAGFKIANLLGWCFIIGVLGTLVDGLSPLISKTYFIIILFKENESVSLVSYNEEDVIRTVNRINDLAAQG